MAFHRVDTASGVVYFCSDKIPARHGFASRLGGVSTNIHTSSLNQAEGRGDSDEIVAENRRRFLDALGLDPDSLVSLSQIHSSRVIYAPRSVDGVSADIERGSGATHDAPPNSQPLGSNTADTNADSREGDGLYTDISGVVARRQDRRLRADSFVRARGSGGRRDSRRLARNGSRYRRGRLRGTRVARCEAGKYHRRDRSGDLL